MKAAIQLGGGWDEAAGFEAPLRGGWEVATAHIILDRARGCSTNGKGEKAIKKGGSETV